jgi:hypothetical protein
VHGPSIGPRASGRVGAALDPRCVETHTCGLVAAPMPISAGRGILKVRKKEVVMRVLVAASSRHGATGAIAEEIGRTLAERGLDVQVTPLEDLSDVAGFDAFVVGSAIYAGRWLAPARAFVDEHGAELRSRPTWLFSSGPLGDPPKPDPDAAVKIDGLVQATGRASTTCSRERSIAAASGSGSGRSSVLSARPTATSETGTTSAVGRHDRRGARLAALSGPSTDRRRRRRSASRRPSRPAGSAARPGPCRRSRSEGR